MWSDLSNLQTVPTCHLSSLLSIIANLSGRLTTNVTVQLTMCNAQGIVQLWAFLVYSLTPWSTVLLEKLTSSQLVMKFPACYGTRKFITTFTSACHLSLSWASSIQSITPHATCLFSVAQVVPKYQSRSEAFCVNI